MESRKASVDPLALAGLGAVLAQSEHEQDVARLAATAVTAALSVPFGAVVLQGAGRPEERTFGQLGGTPLKADLAQEIWGVLASSPDVADIFATESCPEIDVGEALPLLANAGLRRLLLVRLGTFEETFGAVIAGKRSGEPFAPDERATLETLAGQASLAVHRVHKEQALRQSEEQVRLLLNSTGEAIYGVDLRGECTFSNPACLRLLWYDDLSDLLGQNMHDLIHHTRPDGKHYPQEECRVYQAFREGEGTHVDDEVLWRSDGTSFPAEYWSYPIHRDDKIIGSVVTFVDISERKRAQEALHRLNKQLEEVSRHKSEFLANLSHELRTPLNAILGGSELLAEGLFGELNDKQTEYIHDIHESGQHLLSLINDVLDLSKVEAGRLELQPDHFGLRSLMESSVTIVRERASRKSIDLRVEPPAEEVIVEADERKVKQVVYNLLSNAVRFTPDEGKVVFRAHREGDEAIFAIEDSGPGVAEEFRERIFDEFFQAPGAEEGTGLGLALSRRLVELHGGRIWLETEVGQGSRFSFAIPIAREATSPTSSGDLGATQ